MRTTTMMLILLLTGMPAYAQTTSGAHSSVNISNPANTDSKARVITPPTIVAPGLAAAGMETCLGSATGGVSLMGLGFTFGKTTPDEGCAIRLYARQLHAFGFPKAAMALMCQDPRVAAAMTAAGQGCPFASAEIGPRSKRKFVEYPAGAGDRSRRMVFKPWRNPDIVLAQAPAGASSVSGVSPEEEQWFARASAVY